MDIIILLLAQDPVDTAEKTVPILERIIEGGVPLICLAVAVVFAIAAAYQYRRNARQWQVNSELEREFRLKVEALLREMLDRGEDSQEALTSNTQAVRDMTQGMQQLTTRVEYVERAVNRGGGVT